MSNTNSPIDWYERRDELRPDMVFRDYEGDVVRLYRRVEGDATQWHVEELRNGAWSYEESTIEPGDLREQIEDPTLTASGFGI